jgi:hypothetical protein
MEDEYNIPIDAKSKIFFAVLFFVIAGTLGASYYRFVYTKNYVIKAHAQCDPTKEACFVHVCDPAGKEDCTGDPKEDTSYYKAVSRLAKNIPLCDPKDERCDALVCPEGEAGCEVTLCDDSTLADSGDTCNDPEAYNASLEAAASDTAAANTDCAAGDTGCSSDTAPDASSDTASSDSSASPEAPADNAPQDTTVSPGGGTAQ